MMNKAKLYKNATGTNHIHEVQQGDNICRTDNLEFAQKIATSINFLDIVMDALKAQEKKEPEVKFMDYVVGGSWIATIGYARNEQRMRIKKYDGSTIVHFGVPEVTFNEVIKAESVGSAYNQKIRGKYESATYKNE
jgi:hypothetical protein